MIDTSQRQTLLDLVDTAVRDGARLERACNVIGISAYGLQRWRPEERPEQAGTPDHSRHRQSPRLCRPAVHPDRADPRRPGPLRGLGKHRPDLTIRPFESLDAARAWVSRVVDCYNTEHRHGRIRHVTPSQRHAGEDVELLERRAALHAKAKAENPHRWSGKTRNWQPVAAVHLNPQKDSEKAMPKTIHPSAESQITTISRD